MRTTAARHNGREAVGKAFYGWYMVMFNLLVLVGAVKASDRIVKEMMGL